MHNGSTEVDVIIPTFNRKDSLRLCVNSILNSKNNGKYVFNILVIDDASSDGTAEMLKSNFPSVRVITNETELFPCLSMYRGISSTTAEFVVRVDDDNELMQDCLLNLMSCLEDDKSVVFCGAVGLLPNGSLSTNRGGYFRGFLKRRVLPAAANIEELGENPYMVETLDNVYAFRRSFFSEEEWERPCRWFPWGMEDAYQQFTAIEKNYKVVINPKAITIHHQTINRKVNEVQIKGRLRSKILWLRERYSYSGIKLVTASLLYTSYIIAFWIYKSGRKATPRKILEFIAVMKSALK